MTRNEEISFYHQQAAAYRQQAEEMEHNQAFASALLDEAEHCEQVARKIEEPRLYDATINGRAVKVTVPED